VAKAKQAFAAKVDGESSAKQGSQMEEALRKLHGKGVVPTKLAFGTQSKEGTQHADAMKAFMGKEGASVSTGFAKKPPNIGPAKASVLRAKEAAGEGGPTQRQKAMEALQGTLNDK